MAAHRAVYRPRDRPRGQDWAIRHVAGCTAAQRTRDQARAGSRPAEPSVVDVPLAVKPSPYQLLSGAKQGRRESARHRSAARCLGAQPGCWPRGRDRHVRSYADQHVRSYADTANSTIRLPEVRLAVG